MKSIWIQRMSRLLGIVLMAAALTVAAAEIPLRSSAEQELERASQLFDRMFVNIPHTAAEKELVDALLKDAYGFVIFLNVVKAGIGVTQIQGRGVLVYRDANNVWQPPLPLLVSGTGIGPHFGLITYDTLFPLKNLLDIQKVFHQGIVLGGKDSIGPLPAVDAAKDEAISYTRARGLSAGISQDSLHIALDQKAISALYGIQVEPQELFSGKLQNCRKPLPAQKLLERANELATGAPITTIWSSP